MSGWNPRKGHLASTTNLRRRENFLGELELSWKELTETVNHIANR